MGQVKGVGGSEEGGVGEGEESGEGEGQVKGRSRWRGGGVTPIGTS